MNPVSSLPSKHSTHLPKYTAPSVTTHHARVPAHPDAGSHALRAGDVKDAVNQSSDLNILSHTQAGASAPTTDPSTLLNALTEARTQNDQKATTGTATTSAHQARQQADAYANTAAKHSFSQPHHTVSTSV